MDKSNKLLSEVTTFRTYAKFLSSAQRRETFEETVARCEQMHLDRFPALSDKIHKAFDLVRDYKVMPSMRSLQFAGQAVQKSNVRQYNCAFTPIDDVRKIAETLFLLLSGTGVGFSVQKRHVKQLPKIRKPQEEGIFFVHDSIQGWAQALYVLLEAYFYGSIRPFFNFSNIRPKGSPLKTTGAKAPGPKPLEDMLIAVEERLKLAIDRQLKPIEIHDIICIVSDCVLAGGIRRSALISLFDRNDEEMLKCKSGDWADKYPWRGRANNSAVLPRGEVTEEEFRHIFRMCKDSGSGEPGFFWTNDLDWGANPCNEIALSPNQFCNLTSVPQTGVKDKKDFLNRVYNATLLGTLQASYTDFPYLRDTWRQITEKEALIGVSFTGIADAKNMVTTEWLEEAADLVLEVNERIAKKIGINMAARTTCIKPEGTASCVLGSSSGVHARHSKHYIRRIQISKDDALYHYLAEIIPDLVEDKSGTANTAVITFPQEAPEGAICREDEGAIQLFNRATKYNKHWIAPGHRSGANKHNVSCTIYVRDNEWDDLCAAMWRRRNSYAGMSLFPYDGGNYVQAPFEECTEDTFKKYSALVKDIDLKNVHETDDQTNRAEAIACSGGVCEIS